jgi:hypothetical protein
MDSISLRALEKQYELLVLSKDDNGIVNVMMDYHYRDNISLPIFTNNSLGGIFINVKWDEINKDKMYDSGIKFKVFSSNDRSIERHIYICEYKDCPPCLLNILVTRCYFYPIEKSLKFFSKYTKDAYFQYINEKECENNDIMEESYFTNYFNNIFQLYKFKDMKDFPTEYIDKFIKSKLSKENFDKIYNRHKKDIEKRLSKNDGTDELLYFVDRINGADTSIYITFDKRNEYDIASAGISEATKQSMIVLSPIFFTLDFELKKFTLLHELGHIRLNHCKDKNMKMTLKDMILNKFTDVSKYRAKMIDNCKIMYPEANADLYALIHGGSISEFLKLKDIFKLDKDAEKELIHRERTANERLSKITATNNFKLKILNTVGKLFTK